MSLYFGNFDFIFLGIIILLNIIFWKVKFKTKVGCLIAILLFGIIIPSISIGIEVQNYVEWKGGEKALIDSIEMLYTYFRFPIYWLIGTIQLIVISLKNKTNQKNKN